MPKPPPWPERPGSAQSFDRFWLVRGLPPQPFPAEDHDYGADPRFGPPGTRWVFTIEQLIDRRNVLGTSAATKFAIERLVKKLGTKIPPLGTTSWATPVALASPATALEVELREPMDWVRTQITGAIGTDEEVVHVLNWRHSAIENAPIDAAGVKALGNAVRDAFAAFFDARKGVFPAQLRYTEVRSSLLRQGAPNTKPEWPLPTQVSPFSTAVVGFDGGNPLPYEVALGLSLNTNFRGTSRFRGRTYIGPLAVSVMGTNGQFSATAVNPIGASFGSLFLGAVESATDYECHVISQKYGTSAKVTGVRVGVTPDSQRRRRRDRPELYQQVWGNPVGAL